MGAAEPLSVAAYCSGNQAYTWTDKATREEGAGNGVYGAAHKECQYPPWGDHVPPLLQRMMMYHLGVGCRVLPLVLSVLIVAQKGDLGVVEVVTLCGLRAETATVVELPVEALEEDRMYTS